MSQAIMFRRNTANAVLQLNLYCGGAGKTTTAATRRPEETGERSHAQLPYNNVCSAFIPEDELDGCGACVAVGGEPEATAAGAYPRNKESFNADGSLPPSPPTPSTPVEQQLQFPTSGGPSLDEVKRGLQKDDELYLKTLQLVRDYLREYAGCGGCTKTKGFGLVGVPSSAKGSKASETLKKIGDQVIEKHQLAFKGILQKLDFKSEKDLKSIRNVAAEVFRDGVTNWGRIATIISFGAVLARHTKEVHMENCIDGLAEGITDILVEQKRDWLLKHNGWDGFVEFFHVEDPESNIRHVLMAFAGVAGLGASLAYMIR